MEKYIIDNRILEQEDERELSDRKEVFKTIYITMESEIIMKESLPLYKLRNNSPNIIRFPVEKYIFDNGYVDMNVQTVNINSGLTKELIDLNGKDIIDLKLIHMGEKIAFEFNIEILKAIVNIADRQNDITIDNDILTQIDLDKCKDRIKLNGNFPNEIIMYSNTENENIHDICKAIKLKYRNDQFYYDDLDGKYPILIVCDYEKAGVIGMSSLILRNFGEKILENLDTLQAYLRFGVSILDPKAISVLLN